MITCLLIVTDKIGADVEPWHVWYAFGFEILIEAFLVSVIITAIRFL